MSIKLADTLTPMADFPAAMAKDIEFDDSENLQDKLDNGSLGGGTEGKSAYEVAVKNGFTGTEEEWLASLQGEKGDDGRSITGITTDGSNNVIVTFSDNTTQNIGQLNVDVQADFLTSDGFGKLRYYNSRFQYYDDATSAWVDTSVTPDNVYIMNIVPQPVKSINCKYDKNIGRINLRLKEPDDTIVEGQSLCTVEKVIIRRKLGSAPINENDGDFVIEILRKNFGVYANNWYVDESVKPNIGDTYYYKAFPISTTGLINYSDLNVAYAECRKYTLYGFKLDQNESDPASMITYLSDCDNSGYNSAYMDYTNNTFNYGDWGEAWFIKGLKPCMLKYDGTVGYELDPNDYIKKADGTASDVANTAYEGNAMVGVPKVYWKIVDNGDDTANVYISDTKLDEDFHCWSHIDNNGMEVDYCYMPIYTGGLVNGKLRSLSGLAPITSKTRVQEINYAKANNTGSDTIWYTEIYSDRMLIILLLLLIGKSTDTYSIFGSGNNSTYISQNSTGITKSGTLNTKGLFWGSQDNTSSVKVFGMENFWGNIWKPIAGWIYNNGVQKIKLTYGQSDGSTVDGYNLDGAGYISVANSTPSGTTGGSISKVNYTQYGLIPVEAKGSTTTYYRDGLWFTNNLNYALAGGSTATNNQVGAMCINIGNVSSASGATYAPSLSCKPLATS